MFKDECKQLGFFGPKKGGPTHVLMDGGILYVPHAELELFYGVCVRSISNFERVFVVEQKTTLFNFFVDVDYQDDDALTMDQVGSIVKIICDKVESYRPGDARAIVSVAEPKQKSRTVMKTGIHINWPGFVVDQENAINLMDNIVKILNTVYSTRDWSKDIDASVYGSTHNSTRGSGFRMPWSHKKGKHIDCNGKGCPACGSSGRVTEGEYLPVLEYIDPSSMVEIPVHLPTVARLFDTTVRVPDTTEQSAVVLVEEVSEQTKATRGRDEGGFTQAQVKNEVADAELAAHLETFIRKNMEGQHGARVLKIFKTKTAHYVKTNSKYCENLKRNHGSNHVWFAVSKDAAIMQKCFCTCNTLEGRLKGVLCKDFCGRKHQLNKTITELMYPNKILTNNKKATICSFLL